MLEDLSVSSDLYHNSEAMSKLAQNACDAARQLNIPIGVISVCQPEETEAASSHGMIESGGSAVMYRGRAVDKLASHAPSYHWEVFDTCPHEDLQEPGRVHLDPLGNIHICQGVVIGNLFEKPLKQICAKYAPNANPICGPLLAGGPAALVTEYNLPHASYYADACHLCYKARANLRLRFPEFLAPDQMYGIIE
jgi:hypothetical protein